MQETGSNGCIQGGGQALCSVSERQNSSLRWLEPVPYQSKMALHTGVWPAGSSRETSSPGAIKEALCLHIPGQSQADHGSDLNRHNERPLRGWMVLPLLGVSACGAGFKSSGDTESFQPGGSVLAGEEGEEKRHKGSVQMSKACS